MNLRNAAGGLSRFAHLAGLRSAKPMAGDPPGDDEKDKEAKAKAGAEEEDKKGEPEDDDTGDKAKADEGDGEDDDKKPEPDEAKAEARGAARERARCAAIFDTPQAAANLSLAAHLAFETDLTVKQAVGALAAGGAAPTAAEEPRRERLSDRMERQPKASLGTEGGPAASRDTPEGAAASIHAAMKLARGQK